MTAGDRESGVWILAVGILVMLVWMPHFYFAGRLWLQERSARTFRNAFIATMLMVGLSRGVLAGAARLWPGYEWIQVLNLAASPVIFVFLITGAIVSWWTWRHGIGRW